MIDKRQEKKKVQRFNGHSQTKCCGPTDLAHLAASASGLSSSFHCGTCRFLRHVPPCLSSVPATSCSKCLVRLNLHCVPPQMIHSDPLLCHVRIRKRLRREVPFGLGCRLYELWHPPSAVPSHKPMVRWITFILITRSCEYLPCLDWNQVPLVRLRILLLCCRTELARRAFY